MSLSPEGCCASGCGASRSDAVTAYVSIAIPGLLYDIFVPGVNSTGASSRAMVKGSHGGGSRFQKSPFQPVSFSCGRLSASASSIPAVCEPSCRTVIRNFSGSFRHCGMNLAAWSSSVMSPSLIATASDTPPTTALAIEAV
jgi:hypothetical protein